MRDELRAATVSMSTPWAIAPTRCATPSMRELMASGNRGSYGRRAEDCDPSCRRGYRRPSRQQEAAAIEQRSKDDARAEAYRQTGSRAWPGIALAAELMKAKALWNHDAFFDYCDRIMAKDDAYAANRGPMPRPKWEGSTYDPFVDAMWAAYRDKVPDQPGGTVNTMWVWQGKDGSYQPNQKSP